MSEDNKNEEDRDENQPSPQEKKKKKQKRKQLPSVVKPEKPSGRKRSGAKQYAAPDSEACLIALGQLPGLIAMKLVTTAQANSIRGVYGTILQQHHRSRTGRDQPQLNDADVMAMLRADPRWLSMLAPLLTDAQIEAIMEETKDSEDG